MDPEADSAKVQAFLAQSEALFRQHPVWRGCQPEVLDQAVEVGAMAGLWALSGCCQLGAVLLACRGCQPPEVLDQEVEVGAAQGSEVLAGFCLPK